MPTTVPMGWMVSRVLLAVMLLAAIGGGTIYADGAAAEPRNCGRVAGGFVGGVSDQRDISGGACGAVCARGVDSFASVGFASGRSVSCGGDLLPAATQNDDEARKNAPSLYEYSLYGVASLNVLCHAAAIFSRHLFDGPFFVAELCKTASYVMILARRAAGAGALVRTGSFDGGERFADRAWRIIAG